VFEPVHKLSWGGLQPIEHKSRRDAELHKIAHGPIGIPFSRTYARSSSGDRRMGMPCLAALPQAASLNTGAKAISSDNSGPTRGNRRRIKEDRTDRLEGGTPVRDLTSDTIAVQAGVVRWRPGKSGNIADKEGRALGRERQLSARMRPHHKAQLEESVLCSRSRTPDAPSRQRRVSGWAGPRQGTDAMRDKNPRTRLVKL
jgi:hypothetical protein